MKNYLTIFLIIFMLIFSVGCKNSGGSTYAMEKRYDNFLTILPKDVSDDFILDSKDYGNKYKEWQKELYEWIDDTIENETITENEVKERLQPTQIEYAIETLVAREYERILPYTLITNVKTHTDMLSINIKDLEKESIFSNNFYSLKEDEAIVHFTTEDAVFYYVWNYLIGIERPRRFQ